MANQTGRPIAPARKLVAAVLGTVAVFVMVFGLGLSSWAIVVLGLAVLALSIALGMVNVVRRGARAWVSGTAQVKAVSDAPVSSAYGRAELQVVVVAPGLPVTEVLIRDPRVPVDKWPRLGETLPITVDVDDMRRVRIDWPNAPDRADPPPPGASYSEPAYDPAYPDPIDEFDDDLLGEPEPPPWNPGMQWRPEPDEPPPPPPAAPSSPHAAPSSPPAAPSSPPAPPAAEAEPHEGPVVVHDTPAGPVVEGKFVDRDDAPPPPLPRRNPIPTPSSPSSPSSPVSGPPRPAGARPSPRPRFGAPAGAATATVDPDTATSSQNPPHGTDAASPEAAPNPAPTAPEQRPAPDEEPPTARRADHEVDLPLDGDPEPEHSAAAQSAEAQGLVAPPPDTDPDSTGPWSDLGAATYQPDNRADEVITAYPSARPGAAGAIHGIGLTVLVTNLDRSVQFYRDKLGFFEIDKGEGNAVLASGDTRLVLRTVTDLTSAGRLIYLNLEVGDVEAVYRELVTKGVVFEHEPTVVNHGERLELWSATFHDPDGHNVAITQWRSAG